MTGPYLLGQLATNKCKGWKYQCVWFVLSNGCIFVEDANFVRFYWGMSGNLLMTMRILLSLCYFYSFARLARLRKKDIKCQF